MDLNDLRDIPSRISTAVGNVYDLAKNEYGLWTQQDMTPGLRPQDDEATALLRNAIKNNTGMGPNAPYMKNQVGVDPRAIVRTMLGAPGQTRVYTGTPSPGEYGMARPGKFTNTTDITLRPTGDTDSDQNTALHEMIHGIQNQYNERPSRGVDESRAFYGSGMPLTESFYASAPPPPENFRERVQSFIQGPYKADISSKQQVEDYLKKRIGVGSR